MRADAQRNAEKLRRAAAELFQERGLQAPLKEIARRAGVSHGTLYNLFGTREALIDDVVADLAAERLEEVAREALVREDAWDGFAYYIERICELQVSDPAMRDVITGRYPDAERLMAVCESARVDSVRIIERAQRAGWSAPGLHQRGHGVRLRHQRADRPGREGHRPRRLAPGHRLLSRRPAQRGRPPTAHRPADPAAAPRGDGQRHRHPCAGPACDGRRGSR